MPSSILEKKGEKGEFQICPRMDFDILYVEYLR